MEIFTLLEALEDMLDKSRSIPFSSKCIVNKEEILDIIKEIRLKLPDELKQAKWVKEERQRILVEAQNEADEIIKEAENRIISMIDEHEITKKAYEKKVEIIEAEACSDHIHMLVSIPPYLSISQFMGYINSKSALMIFDRHANYKYKYGNRYFGCRGYYVDTVGKNKKAIEEYIKKQLQEDITTD